MQTVAPLLDGATAPNTGSPPAASMTVPPNPRRSHARQDPSRHHPHPDGARRRSDAETVDTRRTPETTPEVKDGTDIAHEAVIRLIEVIRDSVEFAIPITPGGPIADLMFDAVSDALEEYDSLGRPGLGP